MDTRPKRISRPLTADEKARHSDVREKVTEEFPPVEQPKQRPELSGIAARLRAVRKAQHLSYESLAEQAGLPGGNTVKDVEFGRDTNLHHIEAIALALGMKLELVSN